jgi:protein phosphatase
MSFKKPVSEEEIDIVLDDNAAAALQRSAPATVAAPPLPATFQLEIGTATNPGRVRKRNEDSFLVQLLSWCNLDQRHDLGAIIVADGLGGHEAGDQASGMAIQLIAAGLSGILTNAILGQTAGPPPTLPNSIVHAIKEANKAVHLRGKNEPACKGMASTAAVVVIWDGQVKIGHVGDCRVYHSRGDQFTQVTKDQSLVERMVELGQLSRKEAATHPARNEVTQAIGNSPDIAPASYQLQLASGDWLLVVCDGVYSHVETRWLQDSIRKAITAPLLAQQLVEMANQGGGTDNITAVAVRCY